MSVKACLKGVRCVSSKRNDNRIGNKRLNPFFAEVVGYGMELLYSAPHLWNIPRGDLYSHSTLVQDKAQNSSKSLLTDTPVLLAWDLLPHKAAHVYSILHMGNGARQMKCLASGWVKRLEQSRSVLPGGNVAAGLLGGCLIYSHWNCPISCPRAEGFKRHWLLCTFSVMKSEWNIYVGYQLGHINCGGFEQP